MAKPINNKIEHLKPSNQYRLIEYSDAEIIEVQEEFLRLFAESEKGDSLNAYITSHKRIVSARASTLLKSPFAWKKIILYWRSGENSNSYKRAVIKAYDDFLKEHEDCPFDIFNRTVNEIHEDYFDLGPTEIVLNLVQVYHFFLILDRSRFMNKIKNLIKAEYGFICGLSEKNEGWKAERLKILKRCKELGFNINNF